MTEKTAKTTTNPASRSGFALPLSLFMLLTIALLVALLLDAALQELRASRGDLAAARAQAAASSALADFLSSRPDSALLSRPRGAVTSSLSVAGADTTLLSLQSLGGGLVRCVANAHSWSFGARADAATIAFVHVLPDSNGAPGALRFRRLPGWWWAQLP